MECAVCYEAFIIPNSREDFLEIINEYGKNNKLTFFFNYLITPKHNTTYKCPTPECKCIICLDCWNKVQVSNRIDNDNNTHDILDNLPSIYDKFMCPFCRQVDWKNYMKDSVLLELQRKILGEDEWLDLLYNKFHSEDN